MLRYPTSTEKSVLNHKTSEGIWIHEKAEDMPDLPVGRFARLPGDSRIFALACGFPSGGESGKVLVSHDQGKSWEATSPFGPEEKWVATDSGAFVCTKAGTLVAAFSNRAELEREPWDPNHTEGWKLPAVVCRSLDEGKTWQDIQTLHDNWTGANRDMIQTSSGRLLLSTMKLLHNPGRHTVLTYASDDDGATWKPSNIIDLGGIGHHGGVTEASILELKDGRLLMYIRTNWGQLWRAISTDGGDYWHPYGPAGIDSSSTPPFLERLASGRICLVWNRRFPEGTDRWEWRGGDNDWSATPASNFRHELSISFSEDEAETWSAPVVIARNDDGEVCYPYVFEPEPGELWVTAHRFKFNLRLREADFLR